MFIDTSAVVAILVGEPEADRFLDAIEASELRYTAPHVRLESCIIVGRLLGLDVDDAQTLFDGFLKTARINVVAITDALSRKAVDAFDKFGKGRGHPAQLIFADCLSYACAKGYGVPILHKGRDFAQTDLRSAEGS